MNWRLWTWKEVLIFFLVMIVIGGVIALGMIAVRGNLRSNVANTRAILLDLVAAKSVDDVAGKAQARKSRMHLLPYGIPLCLGFIGYLVVGVQAFFRGAIVISANHALVEVGYVHYVEFDIVDPFHQRSEHGFHDLSVSFLDHP